MSDVIADKSAACRVDHSPGDSLGKMLRLKNR